MNDVLRVSLLFNENGEDELYVGRLALDTRGTGVFEYASDFIATKLRVDPYGRPPAPGVVRPANPRDTDNLPGVLADSLPDAWGRLLIERKLRAANLWKGLPSGFEQLGIIGRRGRGALVFEPATDGDEPAGFPIDLDALDDEAERALAGDDGKVIAELATLGGASGGARPKVNVALDDAGNALSTEGALPAGYTHWIVKLPSSADETRESSILEAAYARAARRAGIAVPRTRLIPSRAKKMPYYAIERFDREPDGSRRHMLSAAGALEIAWDVPNISYEGLFSLTRIITRKDGDVREMVRRMIFNVLAHNRDDHAKQHSFLMDRTGTWRLAPAYDLTFSQGPNGYHYAAVNGKGTDITRKDLLADAMQQSLSQADASALINEVAQAVRALPGIAAELGASKKAQNEVAQRTGEMLRTAA